MSGPLFHYSGFPFEGMNGTLVNLVKGTTGVLSQIAEKYTCMRTLPEIVRLYNASDRILNYCSDLNSFARSKVSECCENITLLGLAKCFPFSAEEENAILSSGQILSRLSFQKMIMRSIRFDATCYKRQGKKTNNTVVRLITGEFGVVWRIFPPTRDDKPTVFVLLREINIEENEVVCISNDPAATAQHIKICSLIVYGNLKIVKATDIADKAIFMECEGHRVYVTTFPNTIEKD
jgi:hypothetical protein